MNKNPDSQEKNETEKTQGNFFGAPGIPKSDFREESRIKYEKKPMKKLLKNRRNCTKASKRIQR